MSTHYLEQQSGKIAYIETGSGPLIICVPGMGDLRAEYRFLSPQIASAGYRVISMDIRGHGETSALWPDYSVGAIGSDLICSDPHTGCRGGDNYRHLNGCWRSCLGGCGGTGTGNRPCAGQSSGYAVRLPCI